MVCSIELLLLLLDFKGLRKHESQRMVCSERKVESRSRARHRVKSRRKGCIDSVPADEGHKIQA